MPHLTFFWDTNTDIMFPGWPGESFSSYILALILVFVISLLVEWLSHAQLVRSRANNLVTIGLLRTLMYAIRIALAYLLMLAVMSSNIGVLLAAVAGYSVGFLIFGTQILGKFKTGTYQDLSDLPSLNC